MSEHFPERAPDVVHSEQNLRYKHLQKLLGAARDRRKAGQTVLEGIHLVQGWLDAGRAVELLVVSESGLKHPEVAPLLAACSAQKLALSDKLFAALGDISPGVGVMAQIAIPAPELKEFDFIVLLEDLQDPLNVGGILRSAAAAGVQAVYLSKACADAWSPKVLRGAMGGHLALSLIENADLPAVARDFDGKVWVTTLTQSQSLYDTCLRGKLALSFGNEGAGVSPALLAAADGALRIPMPGAVESLNVAASAAVCLFERVRQTLAP